MTSSSSVSVASESNVTVTSSPKDLNSTATMTPSMKRRAESMVIEEILKDYEVDARPVQHPDDTVTVTMELAIQQITDLVNFSVYHEANLVIIVTTRLKGKQLYW